MRLRTLPVFFAFFVMGYVDGVGALTNIMKTKFELSAVWAGVLPFVAFLAFGIFSPIMGVIAGKKGKKFVVILCLFVTLIGTLLPSISIGKFAYIVIAMGLIGIGMTGLQVGGNTIMRLVSAEGRYASNLSFAQSVKAVGSLSTGFILGTLQQTSWFKINHLFMMFSVITFITLIGILLIKDEHKTQNQNERTVSLASCFGLLKNPFVFMMVLGIFFYVGAEVVMSSWIPVYLTDKFSVAKENAVWANNLFMIGLVISRFAGGAILRSMTARKFLTITAIFGFAASCVMFSPLFYTSSNLIFIGAFLIGLGYGNIFPLIFSILIEYMPERDNELSGLLTMAIVGGAPLNIIMGLIWKVSPVWSFIIPAAAFLYMVLLAAKASKTAKTAA